MDWIDLVQNMDRWRGVMNAVMDFRVSFNVGSFFFSGRIMLYGII